ncbi:major facilitator superfamily transporter [Talaromyces proteolyticus]|uniref:Major facilitator superfamily transporter n=1 Tax=Talaromyces proteolyticus TaxID=1131652 RepID=A0AAD4L8X8_9EURO|nr:major facilitator superfamily transporter [Talaromyces proteolyticus]KAH8706039.1 major facilitator superfamily transporter [Talaromyces proteolyticus]
MATSQDLCDCQQRPQGAEILALEQGQQDARPNGQTSVNGTESSGILESDKKEAVHHLARVKDSQSADANIVDWDGPNDPVNPQNWSPLKRWSNIAVVGLITFNVPLASSMLAPAVPQLLQSFKTNNEALSTFVVSVYILGMAAGPLILAPMSELYGRVIVYHVGNVLFIIFTVACGLATNINMLVAFRFLAGLVGAAPIAIGGGTIADVTTMKQRGTAMSIWSLGPLLGPSVGPVIGGFLSQSKGWRWIFWLLAIIAGVIAIISLVVLRESHAPTLLKRKANRLRTESGNMDLRSKLDSQLSPKELFLRAIVRPCKMLVFSPVCLILSIYSAFVYAMIYFMFSTFSFIFEDHYGFGQGTVGLVFLACGIGMMLGLVIQQFTGDRIRKSLADKYNGGTSKPEYRVPPMFFAGALLPAGLALYGWTVQYHVQWAVPLLGTLLVGTGICIINVCINTYLVDTFTIYAASALAASAVLRSVFAAVLPLFALQLYNKLGLGWGNTLFAFIALGMWPITLLFFIHGEKLRTNPKLQVKL